MNKRLERIASYIQQGAGLVDVGTDHGYLPASLALSGYCGNIIATDIKPGPLDAARRTAQSAGVEDKIEFQLCDGLDKCEPAAVDTIVIAGMGGDTICGILDRAEWCMDRRYSLILQPMTKAEVLRYWLVNNEFELVAEDLVRDGGALYQIIVARFGGVTKLCDGELYTGCLSLLKENPLFSEQLQEQAMRFEKALSGLEGAASQGHEGKIRLLKGIMLQLKEMSEHQDS